MPYCSRCGVDAQDKKECPLCFAPIQFLDKKEFDTKPAYPKTEKLRRFTKKERLFFIWLPLVASMFAAITICLVINLSQGSLSWSIYPTISLGAVILMLTGAFILAKKPLLLNLWIGGTIAGLLYLLDIFTSGTSWFLLLGLPPTLFVLCISLTITSGITFFKRNISTLFLFLTVLIGLFCPLLEILINSYRSVEQNLRWSLIVSIVFATISSIELIYILFVKKRLDLKKYFHA